MASATVAAILVIAATACGGNAASTPSATAPSTAQSPTLASPSATSPVATDRQAIYQDAADELQQYLDSWREDGLLAAAETYLVPSQQPSEQTVQLLNGAITSYQPSRWASADDFTLIVALDLHFPDGDGLSWGEGANTRFVTFSRASSGEPWRMSFATSPG